MTIPGMFGLGGFGSVLVREAHEMLARMQGGGYPSASDTARMRELLAWAHVIALSEHTYLRAHTGFFPDEAVELLDEHERSRGLLADAARTEEQRQARLRTLLSLAGLAPTSSNVERAVSLLGGAAAPTFSVPTLTDVQAIDDAAQAVFGGCLVLGDDFADPSIRRAVVWMLGRLLPAYAWGNMNFRDPATMVARYSEASWDSDHVLGESVLGPGAIVSFTQQRTSARLRDWTLGSRLDAADLRQLQRNSMLSAVPGGALLVQVPTSARSIAFSAQCANAATSQIHTMDGRKRLARVWLRYSTTDRRPGQAGDVQLNHTGSTGFEGFWYTGDGSAPYYLTIAANLTLRVTATEIQIANATGATQYVVGFIDFSGPIDEAGGSKSSVFVSMNDGDRFVGRVNDTFLDGLRKGSLLQAANGFNVQAWSGYPQTGPAGVYHGGGLRRVAVVPYQGSASEQRFVLDAENDWRDRLVKVEIAAHALLYAAPGLPSDTLLNSQLGGCCGYTGTGTTLSVGLGAYEIPLPTSGALQGTISARDTDGALVVDVVAGASDLCCYALTITATDQLGKRTSAAPLYLAALPGSEDRMHPYELNEPQDAGAVFAQVRDREPSESSTEVASSAMHLGPICSGEPRVPVAFVMQRVDRIQMTPSTEAERMFSRRQPVAGRLRRVLAERLTANTTLTIDATEDWRDRLVNVHAIVDTADIRPTQASDATINTVANQKRGAWYTGSGGSSYVFDASGGGAVLTLRVDASTGALFVQNEAGATRSVVAMMEASFQLGPRAA